MYIVKLKNESGCKFLCEGNKWIEIKGGNVDNEFTEEQWNLLKDIKTVKEWKDKDLILVAKIEKETKEEGEKQNKKENKKSKQEN